MSGTATAKKIGIAVALIVGVLVLANAVFKASGCEKGTEITGTIIDVLDPNDADAGATAITDAAPE